MIIQNYSVLAKDPHIAKGLKILTAGLESAIPNKKLKKILNSKTIQIGKKRIKLSNYDSIHLVAFGKAANSMSKTVNSIVKIKNGIIVVPKGTKSLIKNNKFKIFKSGHPLPDQISVTAAKSILKFLKKRKPRDLVIFLVSGGSSALLALPDGITLNDKIKTTKQLLVSGATIQEMNCVRKHLSQIKGGRLVDGLNCDAVSLVMSDVLGDDLSSIASGTTYFDNTKFSNTLKIIKKYRLENKISKSVLNRLRLGASGKIPETPKKTKIPHQIILTNDDCIKSMKNKSKQLGISFKTIGISGDVAKAASKLVSNIPKTKNSCIIFGGETTVHVKGNGKGGRNQELVLRILEKIQKINQDMIISSIGTDGIDGNTKYAGAITKNIKTKSREIKSYLNKNNSMSFFKKYGGLIKTGHTHTNLMDIGLILKLK
jgi:glycerate 2-kinase